MLHLNHTPGATCLCFYFRNPFKLSLAGSVALFELARPGPTQDSTKNIDSIMALLEIMISETLRAYAVKKYSLLYRQLGASRGKVHDQSSQHARHCVFALAAKQLRSTTWTAGTRVVLGGACCVLRSTGHSGEKKPGATLWPSRRVARYAEMCSF